MFLLESNYMGYNGLSMKTGISNALRIGNNIQCNVL